VRARFLLFGLLACTPLPLAGDAGDAAPIDDDSTQPDALGDDGGDADVDVDTVPTTPWAHVVVAQGDMSDVVVDPLTRHVIGAASSFANSTQTFILAAYDATGVPLWNKSAQPGTATDVAVDAAGNVYVIGSTQGFDLGGGPLGAGAFCAKFDPSGVFQWQYGPLSATNLERVRVAPNGTVVLTGELAGSESYGGGTVTSTGSTDAVAVALDSSGQYVAAQHWGTAGAEMFVLALAVDSTSAVYLAGTFQNSIDFGGGAMTAAPGYDGFIAKLSTAFAYEAQTHFQSTASYPTALAVDADDDLLLGTDSYNAMSLGGASVPAPSASNGGIVLAKLDSSLADLWFRQFVGTVAIGIHGVGATSDGALVATGYYQGTVDFGSGALPAAAVSSAFAAELDSNGDGVAAVGRGQGDPSVSTNGDAIEWIQDEDVVWAGSCMGTTTLSGLPPLTCSSSTTDAVIARFQLH